MQTVFSVQNIQWISHKKNQKTKSTPNLKLSLPFRITLLRTSLSLLVHFLFKVTSSCTCGSALDLLWHVRTSSSLSCTTVILMNVLPQTLRVSGWGTNSRCKAQRMVDESLQIIRIPAQLWTLWTVTEMCWKQFNFSLQFNFICISPNHNNNQLKALRKSSTHHQHSQFK